MNAFGKIRYITLSIRSSPQKYQAFKNICKRTNAFNLNNETRWRSGYNMLHRAIELENSVDLWISENDDIKDYKLSAEDWKELKDFHKCLETFSEIEVLLQAHNYPTLWMCIASYNNFFVAVDDLCTIYHNLHLKAGFIKLEKYYEVTNDCPASFSATVLCTKYKLDYFIKNAFKNEIVIIKRT